MSTAALVDARKELLVGYSAPKFFTDGIKRSPKGDGGESSPPLYIPKSRIKLINAPTPIESFSLPELPEDAPPLFLKRDDQTGGIEAMGNKSRKLEFLFADAIEQGCDAIVTAGGTQSNHVRQTAAACARLKIPLEVVVRNDSPGGNGNVLLNRMFGAKLHVFDREELAAQSFGELKGRTAAMAKVAHDMGPDRKAYSIPVGGSNAVGTWGYIEAFHELLKQSQLTFGASLQDRIGTVVAAVGSGGTICGLGVGAQLYNLAMDLQSDTQRVSVVGYGVCDSPEAFYHEIDTAIRPSLLPGFKANEFLRLADAKGLGYAKSTTEELQFLSRVARETGVIFDRCYSAKGLMGLWKDLKAGGAFSGVGGGRVVSGAGRGILFVHTGGAPSLFDAEALLDPVLNSML